MSRIEKILSALSNENAKSLTKVADIMTSYNVEFPIDDVTEMNRVNRLAETNRKFREALVSLNEK
jgi:hypothetical protein